MRIDAESLYRQAMRIHWRTGLPLSVAKKAAIRQTDRYVWRTEGDDRVRPSHAANNGKIFRWDSPPPTGHPGEDHGCRCVAVPYYENITEYADWTVTPKASDSGHRWQDFDFLRHFAFGRGRTVELHQIGHLTEIINQYGYVDGGEGAFSRLTNQMVQAARNEPQGINPVFRQRFEGSYDFKPVEYSHGRAVVAGSYVGQVRDRGNMLLILASVSFLFDDVFTDTVSIRETLLGSSDKRLPPILHQISEGGGQAYSIIGSWSARFEAMVDKNPSASRYG